MCCREPIVTHLQQVYDNPVIAGGPATLYTRFWQPNRPRFAFCSRPRLLGRPLGASMQLVSRVRSQIQYKIILPFLLLTLLVALAGAAVTMLFITSNAQERLNNQLAQTARASGDNLVELERANLQFLRELSFAGPNSGANAPSMADAFSSSDPATVSRALDPYFVLSTQRQGVSVDRMIAFDANGRSIVDWEAPAEAGKQRIEHQPRDLRKLWFVPAILAKQQDVLGDKYSGLLELGDSEQRYLFTVAPVLQGQQVVGGVIVGSRLETVLQELSQRSSAAIVSVYRPEDGRAFSSTQIPIDGLSEIDIRASLVSGIRDLDLANQQSIFDTVRVNARSYQFAYVPLRIRSDLVGLLSVALSSDYVIGPWSNAVVPLIVLTAFLVLAIVGLGILIARQITLPLKELVSAAEAVTGGDLARRSAVKVRDEVGQLSRSFNAMTEHLVDLYGTVHAEASQRAAIVESITDGVVVCDTNGQVIVVNRAMRELLGLREQDSNPSHLNDIALESAEIASPSFGGERAYELYSIGSRIVRVAAAPVPAPDGDRLGDVFVFQDVTADVAIDQAKTNFIATISHELRTPLTVLGGSADLLLRGYVGELSEEQHTLIAAMAKHTQSMTGLLNNVIVIAGLESGTLELDLNPVCLQRVVDDLLWSVRPGFRAKELQLEIAIPDDLPDVVADEQQLRSILSQLLDNARRYTDRGSVQLSAVHQNDHVRIDIRDSGPGIDGEVSANLFTRFVRGAQGINSAERGIGLGLAIVKLLVERQHGTVWLAQTGQNGTTFSFTLPCVHANAQFDNNFLAQAA